VAHDGASFYAEFERFKDELSLVILDVMLPDTDGFTLCRSVRSQSPVPIIMLTASADDTDRPTTPASCWRASRPSTAACNWARPAHRCGI
jgi:DNA-binding response OmpR family regulator